MNFKEYIKSATIRPEEGDTVEYMSIRDKMMSNVLVNSQKEIPGVGCTYEADVTKLLEEFAKLKTNCGYELTLNSLMIKILVEGLKAAPRLNAHFQYNHRATSGHLIIKKHIDVSMAVCLETGKTFQVKVIHLEDKTLKETAFLAEDAKRRLHNTRLGKMMFEVSRQRMVGLLAQGKVISPLCQIFSACFGKGKIVDLSKSLKSDFRKLTKKDTPKNYDGLRMKELNEGTVCFTNWGTLYDNLNVNITYIPPLYPQVFLFGTGRVKETQHVYEDENGNLHLGTKKVLPLTLVFDHKIGGAADIVPFIKKLDEIFGNPEIIHTW
ncbi:MAG: 2-oxo acid dehydrogenase subunit E2 [Clostridia bacterium]|nr:2-oxo acid dehydrogenase subunit E2 [Clostridia bacterium]